MSDCVKELREYIRTDTQFRTQDKDKKEKELFHLFALAPAGESNSQMVSLSDELSQKNEELLRHQEEIAQLLSQIVELQHRVKEVRRTALIVLLVSRCLPLVFK